LLRLNLFDLCDTPDGSLPDLKSFPDIDVYLIAFSILDRTSFDSIDSKWSKDCLALKPSKPIVILGLNCGEESENQRQVSDEEAELYAKSIDAVYVACGSKERIGLSESITAMLQVHCNRILLDSNAVKSMCMCMCMGIISKNILVTSYFF
jgi:GTPase SAR1 family protein